MCGASQYMQVNRGRLRRGSRGNFCFRDMGLEKMLKILQVERGINTCFAELGKIKIPKRIRVQLIRHKLSLTKRVIEGTIEKKSHKRRMRLEVMTEVMEDMRYGTCQELKMNVDDREYRFQPASDCWPGRRNPPPPPR